MLEYMAGMLEEGDTEDLAEGLTEFLDEYAESDEAKILALVTSIRCLLALFWLAAQILGAVPRCFFLSLFKDLVCEWLLSRKLARVYC